MHRRPTTPPRASPSPKPCAVWTWSRSKSGRGSKPTPSHSDLVRRQRAQPFADLAADAVCPTGRRGRLARRRHDPAPRPQPDERRRVMVRPRTTISGRIEGCARSAPTSPCDPPEPPPIGDRHADLIEVLRGLPHYCTPRRGGRMVGALSSSPVAALTSRATSTGTPSSVASSAAVIAISILVMVHPPTRIRARASPPPAAAPPRPQAPRQR